MPRSIGDPSTQEQQLAAQGDAGHAMGAAGEEGKMQTWEYLTLVADLGEHGTWRPWKVNDQVLPNWVAGPALTEYINDLGRLGWELVSAMYTGPDPCSFVGRLFFKRPKLVNGL